MKKISINMVLSLVFILASLAISACNTHTNDGISQTETQTPDKNHKLPRMEETKVGESDYSIKRIEKQLNDLDDKISGLEDKLDEIGKLPKTNLFPWVIIVLNALVIILLLLTVKYLHKKFHSMCRNESKLRTILDWIKEKIKKLSSKLDLIQEEISNSETKHDKPIKLGQIHIDFTPIREDLHKMNSDLFSQRTDLHSLNAALVSLNADFAAIKENDLKLNEALINNETRIDEKTSTLFIQVSELDKKLDSILTLIKPELDIRFHKLQIHFPDQNDIIRKSFRIMEQSEQNQIEAMRTFIQEFSQIIRIYALSEDIERLSLVYEILKDILKQYELELILPVPNTDFDETLMNQDKVHGESRMVYKIVFPGFMLNDHTEKALVDVK